MNEPMVPKRAYDEVVKALIEDGFGMENINIGAIRLAESANAPAGSASQADAGGEGK